MVPNCSWGTRDASGDGQIFVGWPVASRKAASDRALRQKALPHRLERHARRKPAPAVKGVGHGFGEEVAVDVGIKTLEADKCLGEQFRHAGAVEAEAHFPARQAAKVGGRGGLGFGFRAIEPAVAVLRLAGARLHRNPLAGWVIPIGSAGRRVAAALIACCLPG